MSELWRNPVPLILASAIVPALLVVTILLLRSPAAPRRADRRLEQAADRLRRNHRVIVVAVSLVFGTWFLLEALRGFGII